MKKIHRHIAIYLVLVLALSMVPPSVAAEKGSATGPAGDLSAGEETEDRREGTGAGILGSVPSGPESGPPPPVAGPSTEGLPAAEGSVPASSPSHVLSDGSAPGAAPALSEAADQKEDNGNAGLKAQAEDPFVPTQRGLFAAPLNPGPFTVSPSSILVSEGGVYGPLPDPEPRKYYTFLGWYTAKAGGYQVGEGALVTLKKGAALYARWKTDMFTLRFSPNGGSVSVDSYDYSYAEPYQELPTPLRPGYSFVGWYTARTGGKKIDRNTKCVITQTTEVFARWAPVWYLQIDTRWNTKWYRVRKETSTIGGAGCGPSSMAMVISTLKAPGTTPVETCAWSQRRGYKAYLSGTYDSYFRAHGKATGIAVTQLSTTSRSNMSKAKAQVYDTMAMNAIKRGDFVIALMGKGNWTKVGHFVLWYGMEGNNVLIRDPASTAAGRAKNTLTLFKSQVKRYWVISVPGNKKLNPV